MNIARVHLADYDAISHRPSSWTSTFTAAQLLYVEFCENLVYQTTYDSCLRALIKNSANVHAIEKQAGISETLAEIKAQVDAEVDTAAPPAIEDASTLAAPTDSPAQIRIVTRKPV